jgi:hypothetical protein
MRTHREEHGSAWLRDRLAHIYWIGGGSGAGKSTIAACIADRYDLEVYATDDVMSDHGRRSSPETAPHLQRFAAMDMDERWVNRSPETMLDTFHWYRGEGFDLIVEDLLALPADRGVVAEGFRLLPELVASRGVVSGFFRHPSSAGLRSRAGAGCGRSSAEPATLTVRCATCWSGIVCSLSVSTRRRPASGCR